MRTYNLAVWFLVFLIILSFFLPWINIQSKAGSLVTRGFRISLLKQSEDADFIFNAAKFFSLTEEELVKKGKLVWTFPLFAMIIACMVYLFGKNRFTILIIALIGLIMFLIGLYHIAIADLDKVIVRLNIGYGLWLTLVCYLGIFIFSFINFLGKSGNNKAKNSFDKR